MRPAIAASGAESVDAVLDLWAAMVPSAEIAKRLGYASSFHVGGIVAAARERRDPRAITHPRSQAKRKPAPGPRPEPAPPASRLRCAEFGIEHATGAHAVSLPRLRCLEREA